jgi:uracil-DNA glycosylase
MVMIAEAAPSDACDYFYAKGNPLFAQTTILVFNDAGANFRSIKDILARGVYLTTAYKCGKTGYGVSAGTIEECSRLLEQELALFPNVKAFLLMGDAAIKAINDIAKRAGEPRVIPAGSTYKIRGGNFSFRGARAFPSYLQAGPAFFVEKSKRKMIAQDIARALRLVR